MIGTIEEYQILKDALIGSAEELSCKGGTSKSKNQKWWTEEVAKAITERFGSRKK